MKSRSAVGASKLRRYQTVSPARAPIPDSPDSGQKGTTIVRSNAGASPAPNSHSPFRLCQAARRRLGRGYSGRGPMAPPDQRLRSGIGERSLSRAIIPSRLRVRRHARHVSVKDVAARSGVSFQTTSKVLNGGGSVSDVTRARILRVASELGYVPNLQARSLVMQHTRTVGLISGDFSDPGLSRCLAGAEQEARRQGYGLILTSIEPEGSATEYALPAMMERRVDGILLAAPQMEEDTALSHVLDPTLPVVSLNHIAGGSVSTVCADDVQAGYIATHHLLQGGHRVVGVLTGIRGLRLTQSRQRGYRKALEEAGV